MDWEAKSCALSAGVYVGYAQHAMGQLTRPARVYITLVNQKVRAQVWGIWTQ